jgi:hypothetical protein
MVLAISAMALMGLRVSVAQYGGAAVAALKIHYARRLQVKVQRCDGVLYRIDDDILSDHRECDSSWVGQLEENET